MHARWRVLYVCMCVCVWLCVWELCGLCHSPAVAGKVLLAREKKRHTLQVLFCAAQRPNRKGVFIENSRAFAADGQLCVCDGTCVDYHVMTAFWRNVKGAILRELVINDGKAFYTDGKRVWMKCTSISGWCEGHTHTHTFTVHLLHWFLDAKELCDLDSTSTDGGLVMFTCWCLLKTRQRTRGALTVSIITLKWWWALKILLVNTLDLSEHIVWSKRRTEWTIFAVEHFEGTFHVDCFFPLLDGRLLFILLWYLLQISGTDTKNTLAEISHEFTHVLLTSEEENHSPLTKNGLIPLKHPVSFRFWQRLFCPHRQHRSRTQSCSIAVVNNEAGGETWTQVVWKRSFWRRKATPSDGIRPHSLKDYKERKGGFSTLTNINCIAVAPLAEGSTSA